MSGVTNLPGMNCGLCGYRSCEDFGNFLNSHPEQIKRCIYLSEHKLGTAQPKRKTPALTATSTFPAAPATGSNAAGCGADKASCAVACGAGVQNEKGQRRVDSEEGRWKDSLGRDFDFFLDQFPEDPGPREVIIPHNPMLTRELEIQKGEILIGRPLGMSCGCPITHCGIVHTVDYKTGVITWFVTGPLDPRNKGYKDMGYYIAEGYEGLISESRVDVKLGMRYFFQPRRCMLHWRHSGLVNYVNRTPAGLQVRVEGLWIG